MATIRDIAKAAGVSITTVSHVVNGTRFVSPKLVERVEQAIEELDYLPNFVVKNSDKGISLKNKYIIIIKSDKNSNYQNQVTKRLEEILKDSKFSTLTMLVPNDVERIIPFFKFLLHSNWIVGAFVFPDQNDCIVEKVLKKIDLPVVMLDTVNVDYRSDIVISDTLEGVYKATRYYIQMGHEKIIYVGTKRLKTSRRLEGYKKALKENKIQIDSNLILNEWKDEVELFNLLDYLMNLKNCPTALFVANYSAISLVLKYVKSRDIVCPRKLSILSFNDFAWADMLNPTITTVFQDYDRISFEAYNKLTQRIEQSHYANKIGFEYNSIYIPTNIHVRESTCGIGRGPFGEKAESEEILRLNQREIDSIKSKNYTVAVSFHYLGTDFSELLQKGIKQVFNELNITLIAITDAHFNPALQNKQLESFLMMEPSAIIAFPTDNKLTSPIFKKIANSNSKLVFITNVPDGIAQSDFATCVSVNENTHGSNIGNGLGEYMTLNKLKNFGMLVHGANFYATNQRDTVVKRILFEEYDDLNCCGIERFNTEEEVSIKTRKLIMEHPEIEALYITWDGPALQAISALMKLDRTDIIIATGDLGKDVAINMAKGGMIKVISAQCPFEEGKALAYAIANSLLKKNLPKYIGIEPITVTQRNLIKAWKQVFHRENDPELLTAFSDNPNYVN